MKKTKKPAFRLDYHETPTEIIISRGKEEYDIKMYSNEVIVKDKNGKIVKPGTKIYDEIMLFCIQNSAVI